MQDNAPIQRGEWRQWLEDMVFESIVFVCPACKPRPQSHGKPLEAAQALDNGPVSGAGVYTQERRYEKEFFRSGVACIAPHLYRGRQVQAVIRVKG